MLYIEVKIIRGILSPTNTKFTRGWILNHLNTSVEILAKFVIS